METFGQRVRNARLRCGWTQKELADASGLTQSAVGNYESGQRVKPTAAALLKIARALRVSPAWLSEGSGSGEAMDALSTGRTSTAGRREHARTRAEGIWPFRKVEFEAYLRLTPSEKRMLESLVETFISTCSEKR